MLSEQMVIINGESVIISRSDEGSGWANHTRPAPGWPPGLTLQPRVRPQCSVSTRCLVWLWLGLPPHTHDFLGPMHMCPSWRQPGSRLSRITKSAAYHLTTDTKRQMRGYLGVDAVYVLRTAMP